MSEAINSKLLSDDQEATIPFNRSYIAGRELYYIAKAVSNGDLKGDGYFTKKCSQWIKNYTGTNCCLLTPSCTAALEMCALLLELKSGDEVILPSFTFTSTANAFALHGASLRFADLNPQSANITAQTIKPLINKRTKAICVVHYGGIACEMDEIMELALSNNLIVIEDAAHAIMSSYKGRPLGTIGHFGTYSFHETKNYSAGEGGALLINDPRFVSKAEIIREKGTNRSQFFRGEIDKYTWIELGSSFLPSELVSAFLYGQLERAYEINQERLRIWSNYNQAFSDLEAKGLVKRPFVPDYCVHNAHLFYLILPSSSEQISFIEYLRQKKIGAVFHYLPLHSSPMGNKLHKLHYKSEPQPNLPFTDQIANTIVRLPLFCGLTESEQQRVIEAVLDYGNFKLSELAHSYNNVVSF